MDLVVSLDPESHRGATRVVAASGWQRGLRARPIWLVSDLKRHLPRPTIAMLQDLARFGGPARAISGFVTFIG